ncbi:hypothetical protein BYT27DRAFT_7189629 [Phlegmacium glaucopus]|nr:hypothetical protein BYT27DRAFT_7189629 [Phlegmacium glaucopus]
MSTVTEDSTTVAVDHDAPLDFVDKIPDGDHAGMPIVHVTEPTSPIPQSTTPEPALLSTPSTPNSLPEEAYQQRRARHRSAIETRSSNRLSGFFTNLIHRRDSPTTPGREAIPEGSSHPDSHSKSEAPSRASSPHPVRPVTPPPPPLPPPTLKELGLSLSAITSSLSPSHFSTPPSSGAFLSPHYLLLCHAQGLDVLPLVAPPALRPYALVRRVSFKNIVVMEQRGVLVAIAGRRDGVRVYALQEVKRVIEWRIDTEIKRERDKLRKETVKKVATRINDSHDFSDKFRKASLSTPPQGEPDHLRANLLRKRSHNPLPVPVLPPPVPLVPRSATPRTPRKRKNPSVQTIPGPSGRPPPYTPSEANAPPLQSRPSYVSLRSRGAPISSSPDVPRAQVDRKAEWVESSDDEAIDVVAAGSSGSHLDERTSATLSSNRALTSPPMQAIVTQAEISTVRHTTASVGRRRPSNLDLSLTRPTTVPAPEPSPVPTLLTLRQALSQPLSATNPETPFMEVDDEEDVEGHISLAQALLESRIPDLPPIGTSHPQEPILIASSPVPESTMTEPSSPRTTDGHSSIGRSNTNGSRRRRWSIMISSPTSEPPYDTFPPTPTRPLTASSSFSDRFSRSRSFLPQTPTSRSFIDPPSTPPEIPSLPDLHPPPTSRSSRFFPRIINALHVRRSDERFPAPSQSLVEGSEGLRWTNGTSQTPPPKLEYVKLPGTKGALLIKAVETAKKSFLAILCGENGEKVELFAGTYRTALGLSRTFILPDSPRSLELQLQGDDLVEVFLVFAQNVFGLEPATVRVREVRIGRAERRAARRRARENRGGDPSTNDADNLEEETNVNVSIGVTMPVASSAAHDSERSNSPTLVANDHPESQTDPPQTPIDPAPSSSVGQAEELVVLATAQMGPYTTFQQLAFAPNFPLASIADDYIIPPTYPSFLEYKGTHEGDGNQIDLARTQFSPPGLPLPTPTAPCGWFYRDPKNVVHGPWKASLMQAWYKDGLLPPDLPVRREEDTEYMLLKELRLQSVDPTQPFRVISPLVIPSSILSESSLQIDKPLLSPISLLEQPRHFGPPALFFSSRGGHSTSIVDSRGRSVLKGKFFWSNDNSEETKSSSCGKMGDIKRLEALDVRERAVLVALRQGGLEVVDLGDALLKPADESRTTLPHYNPPQTNISRRAPFVWKLGTPIVNPQLNELICERRRMHNQLNGEKASTGSKQSSSGRPDPMSGNFEMDPQDEVLFLGRKEDEIYFCERTAVSFRILRLSTTDHDMF